MPHDHLEVLAHGATAEPEPGPVAEGADVSLKLVEIGRYDAHAGVGKLDGLAVVVAGGSNLIGKKVTARLERVMNGVAWATLVSPAPRIDDPITAESEAERPTRSRRRTPAKAGAAPTRGRGGDRRGRRGGRLVDEVVAEEIVARGCRRRGADVEETVVGEEQPAAEGRRRRRRHGAGTRGGRNRRKKPAASVNGGAPEAEAAEAPAEAAEAAEEPTAPARKPAAPAKKPAAPAEEPAALAPARIHLPARRSRRRRAHERRRPGRGGRRGGRRGRGRGAAEAQEAHPPRNPRRA